MSDYRIPPPSEIDDEQRAVLIKSSFSRIWDNRDELTPPGEGVDRQPGHGTSVHDLSVLLLIRMATRLSEPEENQGERGEQSTELSAVSRQERVRQALFDYVMTDFQSRLLKHPSITRCFTNKRTQREIGRLVDERRMV